MAEHDTRIIGNALFEEVSLIPKDILLRNQIVSVGDIKYTSKLPSYLRLECVKAGTTGLTAPDYVSMSTGGGQ